MSAQAGWYPDPSDPAQQRWWDGAQWTAHARPVPPATAVAPVTPAAPTPVTPSEPTPDERPAPRYGEYAPAAPEAAPPAAASQPGAAHPGSGYPGGAGYPVAPPYPAAPAYAPVVPKVDVDTNTVWVWLAIAATLVPFFTLFLVDWNGYIDVVARSATNPSVTSEILQWQAGAFGISIISWVAVAAFIVFSWLDWRELGRRGVAQPFHWAWSFFALANPGAAVYMIGRAVVLGRRTVSGGWAPLWVWIGGTVLGFIVTIIWAVNFVEAIFTRLGGLYV